MFFPLLVFTLLLGVCGYLWMQLTQLSERIAKLEKQNADLVSQAAHAPKVKPTPRPLTRQSSMHILTPKVRQNLFPLDDSDCKLLVTNATSVTIPAGGSLLPSASSKSFYLHISGSLEMPTKQVKQKLGIRIAKDTVQSTEYFADSDSLIGEGSFLSSKSDVPFIAKTECVLLELNISLIKEFIFAKHQFGKRFYVVLARGLVEKLNFVTFSLKGEYKRKHSIVSVPHTSLSATVVTKPGKNEEQMQLLERFHLPSSETLVDSFSCALARRVGTMIVTPHFVCFHSKFFSLVSKVRIFMSKIVGVAWLQQSKKQSYRFSILYGADDATKNFKFSFTSEKDAKTAYNLIDELRKIFTEVQIDSANEEPLITENLFDAGLSSADWDHILQNSRTNIIQLAKGEVILTENAVANRIFQVATGKCVVRRTLGQKMEVVGHITTGEIFGEIPFFLKNTSTAEVSAIVPTTLYAIEYSYVEGDLWKANPQLVLRLSHYLCSALHHRITDKF